MVDVVVAGIAPRGIEGVVGATAHEPGPSAGPPSPVLHPEAANDTPAFVIFNSQVIQAEPVNVWGPDAVIEAAKSYAVPPGTLY